MGAVNHNRHDLPRWSPEEARRRPADLDPGLGEQICARIANGETLGGICRDKDMPLPATFLKWCRQDPELARLYEEAQSDQCEIMLDELPIVAGHLDARVGRNEIDARRLVLEKKLPKKYGPRSYMNVAPTAEQPGGVEASEVRRKLEQMATRAKENAGGE